jgi:O-antigen/teichoic acid export membrane protein
VARIVAFAAVVYIARVLGASEYGVIEVAGAIVLYFGRLADAGFELGLGVREVAARPDDRELVGTALVARTLISIALVIGLIAAGLTFVPPPEGPVLAAYSLTLLAVGASSRWVLMGHERTKPVAVARTLGEVIMVLGVVLFVRGPEDILGVPFAKLAGDGLAAVLLLWWIVRRLGSIPWKPKWRLLRPLAPRAGRLVLGTLCGLMIYNADVIIIRLFREPLHVGHYAAAYALISFLSNLGMAYALSLLPTVTRLADRPDEQMALYATAHAQVFAVTFPMAIAVTFLAGAAIRVVFGMEYAPATLALSILIWSVPIGVLLNIPFVAFMSRGREGLILWLTAISAGVNVVLNFVLIPRFGIEGAATATVATEAVRMVIMMRVAHGLGFRSPGPGRDWRAALAGVPMAAGMWWAGQLGWAAAAGVGAAVYALWLTILGGLRWHRGRLPTLEV